MCAWLGFAQCDGGSGLGIAATESAAASSPLGLQPRYNSRIYVDLVVYLAVDVSFVCMLMPAFGDRSLRWLMEHWGRGLHALRVLLVHVQCLAVGE